MQKFAPLSTQKWCKFLCVIQKHTKFVKFAGLYLPHFTRGGGGGGVMWKHFTMSKTVVNSEVVHSSGNLKLKLQSFKIVWGIYNMAFYLWETVVANRIYIGNTYFICKYHNTIISFTTDSSTYTLQGKNNNRIIN